MNRRIKKFIIERIPYLCKGYFFFLKLIDKYSTYYYLKTEQNKYKAALERLKGKEVIRCVFFVIDSAVFKFDSLYRHMASHPRFDPVIFVCPMVNYGREAMLKKMNATTLTYQEKGYNVIKSYDETSNTYVDVRKELRPDIIAYTNPYKAMIDRRYYITNYMDILSFYVHYGYNSATFWDMLYKQPLTNIVWRYYVETPFHMAYVHNHSYNRGRNCVITGYPGIEDLVNPQYKIRRYPWKIVDSKMKRIIWAPHHSIKPSAPIHFSNFLCYSEFMVELARKNVDKLQIAFKPHPLLREYLVDYWGKERTDKYYQAWAEMPNTIYSDGEYIDLFLTSDAMIHDSASFLIEYLYARKPVMRLMNGDDMSKILNGFAQRCLDCYYKGYNKTDIESFICNIINNVDPLKDQRENHFKKELFPENSMMPSENIVNDLLESINNQVLF